MSFPGAILMGAQSRLLPMSIPYRFFLAAAVFHLVAWILLAFSAEQVEGYLGGPGPVLAVIHALTLGVFVTTAFGASFQMLPVATGQGLRNFWPARLASWLYIPGLVVLLAGFYTGEAALTEGGGALVALGLVILLVMVGDLFWRTRGVLFVLRLFGWAALAALVGFTALGLTAVADMRVGFLDDRLVVGLAHLILAAFGFMGLLSFGYSAVLVPMFALSPAPSEAEGMASFALALVGLALALLGAVFSHTGALILGGAVGLGAVAVYLKTMVGAIKTGMRKNLGLSFVLVKVSWVCLPLSLVVGIVTAGGWLGDKGVIMFVYLTLFGWLLSLLLGILQRIIPFLASMNAGKGGVRLSELADERLLRVHAVSHFSALALVGIGIAAASHELVLGGAVIGAVGALAFLWYSLEVFRRLLSTRMKTEKEKDVSTQATDSSGPT